MAEAVPVEDGKESFIEGTALEKFRSGVTDIINVSFIFRRQSAIRSLLNDCSTVGRTTLCRSYPSYLSVREQIIGHQYKIELKPSAFDEWQRTYELYKSCLLALPSSDKWDCVYWIGSTAVPGLHSKPIIDMMITTSLNVTEVLHDIALETADPRWRAEHPYGLRFPVGFQMKQEGNEWGFLQMPGYIAKVHSLVECNLHILHSSAEVVEEKILMRDFLRSTEGAPLLAKYAQVKIDLEELVKIGKVDSSGYNGKKSSIIAEIIGASKKWKIANGKRNDTAINHGDLSTNSQSNESPSPREGCTPSLSQARWRLSSSKIAPT